MKNSWVYIRLILITLILVGLYAFAIQRNTNRKVSNFRIQFQDEAVPLLTHSTVNNLLIEKLGKPNQFRKEKVNLMALENMLNKNPMVEKSQVYISVDGTLQVKIFQRKPLVRYINGYETYYIDDKGKSMPLSDNFSVRLPLVTGNIAQKQKDSALVLFKKINDDDFLRKNIIGLEFLPDKTIQLKAREVDFTICFGKLTEIEKKLNNYKAYFQYASERKLLSKYQKINLQFTQQVICTK